METGQLAALFAAIVDPMDKCLFAIGVFCALRTAEVFGLIWSSYLVDQFRLSSTAWHHELYRDNAKTQPSRNSIPNPELIRPYIVQWQSLCPDTSPDALMFPYTPKWGQYKGQVVPWDSYHFMSTRILPLALELGIPANLVNFQVFRRTAMTELQDYGTIKDLQTLARHATPVTTLGKYIFPITENVRNASNRRTGAVLKLTPSPCIAVATDLQAISQTLAPQIGNLRPSATMEHYIRPINSNLARLSGILTKLEKAS
jgi:integrase